MRICNRRLACAMAAPSVMGAAGDAAQLYDLNKRRPNGNAQDVRTASLVMHRREPFLIGPICGCQSAGRTVRQQDNTANLVFKPAETSRALDLPQHIARRRLVDRHAERVRPARPAAAGSAIAATLARAAILAPVSLGAKPSTRIPPGDEIVGPFKIPREPWTRDSTDRGRLRGEPFTRSRDLRTPCSLFVSSLGSDAPTAVPVLPRPAPTTPLGRPRF
jgi:hypothetical protein